MTAKRQPHILVVDDDLEIRNLLGKYLVSQEFRVSLVPDLKSFKKALASSAISLAVLDVMLPDGSGLDMCRDLRAQKSSLPIILLTARKEDIDRIIGLEFGADDYLGKPFNPRELVANATRPSLLTRGGMWPAHSPRRPGRCVVPSDRTRDGPMLPPALHRGAPAPNPFLGCDQLRPH